MKIEFSKKSTVFVRYLSTLLSVLIIYGLYAWIAVPVLEGPSRISRKSAATTRLVSDLGSKDAYQLTDLFPDGSWELSKCKTLATRFGKILFKDYQPKDDGTLRISPITMILNDRKQTNQDAFPFVLRSEKGAVLKFDQPITLGAEVGELEGGRFLGNVVLQRKSRVDGAVEVELLTSNLQFSEQRIYTLEDVQFQFGAHSGSGRNLNIELVGDDLQSKLAKKKSNTRGVKFLELATLERLVLQPASRDQFKSQFQQETRPPVFVNCSGAFKIDFENEFASFNKDVRVTQKGLLGDQAVNDTLTCDRLRIDFSESTEAQPNPGEPASGKGREKWEMDRLVAVGSPSTLDFQSRDARAIAEWLEYNMSTGRVVAQNSDPSKNIYLRHGLKELEARDIDYQITEDGTLGALRSHGPGWLTVRSKKTNALTQVKWQGHMDVRPHQGKKVASLYGRCTIISQKRRSPAKTVPGVLPSTSTTLETWQVNCDELHVYMWEVQKLQTQPAAVALQKAPASELIPSELLATGNVIIQSDRLFGKTNEVTAYWPAPESRVRNPQLSRVKRNGQIRFVQSVEPGFKVASTERPTIRKVDYSPKHQSVNIRQLVFKPQQTGTPTQSEQKSPSRYQVRGDKFDIQMEPHSELTKVKELTIKQNAQIWQEGSNEKSGSLHVNGHEIRWVPKTDDLARIIVAEQPGKMAQVKARESEIFGNVIQLDQLANKAWIKGPGRMFLHRNSAAKKDGVQRSLAASSPRRLLVEWLGGMVFDGSRVYFEQDVLASGTRPGERDAESQFRADAQSMMVVLNQRVSFVNSDSMDRKNDIEVDSITMHGKLNENNRTFPGQRSEKSRKANMVFVETETFRNGSRSERNQFLIPSITISDFLNKIDGSGPGVVKSTRLSDDQKLTFIRVDFERKISGRLDHQFVDLRGKVKTVQSLVGNWNQEVQFDQKSNEQNQLTRLVADQIQIAQWQKTENRQASAEFTAIGNAHVDNFQFNANAHRISYAQNSEKVTIEGGSRTDARINYRRAGMQSWDKMAAQKITYFKDTGEVRVDGTKKIKFKQTQSPGRERSIR